MNEKIENIRSSKKSLEELPTNEAFDDFEAWEVSFELREQKDYPALIKYYKHRAEVSPTDLNSQCYLAEAYNLNGEYKKTIDLLAQHHRQNPDYVDIQYMILDALFALGKNEEDFDWVEKPELLKISKNTIDSCYYSIKSEKKPQSIQDLYYKLTMDEYLYVSFTEEDLLKALIADNNFIVNNAEKGGFAEISIRYVK